MPLDRDRFERRHRWALRAVTAVTLLAVALVLLTVLTACRREPAPTVESGTVTDRHVESLPDGRTRAYVTVSYPSGGSVVYRLDGSTPCVVGSTYPDCAG